VETIQDEGAKNREHVDSGLKQMSLQQGRDRILRSLKYDSMMRRLDHIEIAHRDTCRWIMQCGDETTGTSNGGMPSRTHEYRRLPKHCFHCWATNAWSQVNGVYWVQGKAGSGKSTCMKFIFREGIPSLAPEAVVVAHSVLAVGDELQRSTRGILLALLHQYLLGLAGSHDDGNGRSQGILDSVVELYPHKDSQHDWLTKELTDLLVTCVSKEQWPVVVVLDGLDEVLEKDQQKVLDLVDNLSAIDSVRVCVSSRPEPIFRSHLESRPSLRMEDLTRRDIESYAKSNLLELRIDSFPVDGDRDRLLKLANTVAWRADGVFLWAVLVVGSLQRGIRDGDTLRELEQRLEQMPSDLYSLYQDMWSRLNNDDKIIYRSEAASYLGVLREWHNFHVGAWQVCHIFHLMAASKPSMARETLENAYPVPAAEVEASWKLFARRLVARTGGLIMVNEEQWFIRGFVHRSVLEFLENTAEGQHIMAYDQSSPAERVTNIILAAIAAERAPSTHSCPSIHEIGPRRTFISRVRNIGKDINERWALGGINDDQAIELVGYFDQIYKGGNRMDWEDHCGLGLSVVARDLCHGFFLVHDPSTTPFDPLIFDLTAMSSVCCWHKIFEYRFNKLKTPVSPVYYRYLLLLQLNRHKWDNEWSKMFLSVLEKANSPRSGPPHVKGVWEGTALGRFSCEKVGHTGADLATFLLFTANATAYYESSLWERQTLGMLVDRDPRAYYESLPRIDETLETYVGPGGGVDPNQKVAVILYRSEWRLYYTPLIACLKVGARQGSWQHPPDGEAHWVAFETTAAWLIPLFYHKTTSVTTKNGSNYEAEEGRGDHDRGHTETSPVWDPREVASRASGLAVPPIRMLAFGDSKSSFNYDRGRGDIRLENNVFFHPGTPEDTSHLTSFVLQAFEEENAKGKEGIHLEGLKECLEELRPRARKLYIEEYRQAVFNPAHMLVQDFFQNPPTPSTAPLLG